MFPEVVLKTLDLRVYVPKDWEHTLLTLLALGTTQLLVVSLVCSQILDLASVCRTRWHWFYAFKSTKRCALESWSPLFLVISHSDLGLSRLAQLVVVIQMGVVLFFIQKNGGSPLGSP